MKKIIKYIPRIIFYAAMFAVYFIFKQWLKSVNHDFILLSVAIILNFIGIFYGIKEFVSRDVNINGSDKNRKWNNSIFFMSIGATFAFVIFGSNIEKVPVTHDWARYILVNIFCVFSLTAIACYYALIKISVERFQLIPSNGQMSNFSTNEVQVNDHKEKEKTIASAIMAFSLFELICGVSSDLIPYTLLDSIIDTIFFLGVPYFFVVRKGINQSKSFYVVIAALILVSVFGYGAALRFSDDSSITSDIFFRSVILLGIVESILMIYLYAYLSKKHRLKSQ